MTSEKSQAEQARHLWAATWQGVLSTQSAEALGYPFGSVVPFVLGRDGQPLLLLSPLSQHTRNIERDRRCSLTVMQQGTGDVQQLARLTALGDVARNDASADSSRYFRYFPHARPYWTDLGFLFYQFDVHRLHWNGGFATARWFGRERIIQPNPVDASTEQRIVETANRGTNKQLQTYMHRPEHRADDVNTEMAGIDALGIDLRRGGQLTRVSLTAPLQSNADALALLDHPHAP